MTVIVYRDRVMAADSAMNWGHAIMGSIRKIEKTGSGALVAGTGSTVLVQRFMKGVQSGMSGEHGIPDKESDGGSWNALVVQPDGAVWFWDSSGGFIMHGEYVALGSGMDFAMGALHMGATALQAVEAAIKHCNSCGGDIQVEILG